jgi:hypothetical protein
VSNEQVEGWPQAAHLLLLVTYLAVAAACCSALDAKSRSLAGLTYAGDHLVTHQSDTRDSF